VTGLWLLHDCRRAWALEGQEYSFDELVALAKDAPSLRSLIEPNDPAFSDHGDMPARVRAFCAHTGQPEPVEPGAVVRCILESLALKHAQTIDVLASVTGTEPEEIHLVGGGSRNELLCRWTASAAGLPVLAGPEEATLLGNFLVQAMSLGELASIDDGRAIVRASFAPTIYEPEDRALWREARERFARAVALPTLGVSA
jgi:rhamnulokinase